MAKEQAQIKILRLLGTDVKGSATVKQGMTRVKGIGSNLAHTICSRMNINGAKLMGELSSDEIKALETKLKSLEGVEEWMLNRQKDYDSGLNKHLLTNDLKITLQFDRKRLQKAKTYRGLRLAAGLPVRGQRTKAHFRKGGKAVGVKRKGKK
jgi:small subunit ribosomal protein S13